MKHVTTDPICVLYREPTTWWQRWRHDRRRGKTCMRCLLDRAATLAIVEQLRISNLIALGYGGDEADCDQARSDARAALVEWHAHEDPEMGGWPEIRPEIAAALGIEL